MENTGKISEIVAKFKNGDERIRKSATLNNVVYSLANGADPITIIDQLITNLEVTQKEFESYINKEVPHVIVIDKYIGKRRKFLDFLTP